MLTYQLQRRVLMREDKNPLSFPNKVTVEEMFEPSSQYGGCKEGKTVIQGSKIQFTYDANSGKSWVSSEPSLGEVDTTVEWKDLRLSLKGNKLTAIKDCKSLGELINSLITLRYMVPVFLNIELAEPPVVKYTSVKVGDAKFNWELQSRTKPFEVTNAELQEKKIMASFARLNLVNSRRLDAAAYYYYVARRLSEAGNSEYEFLAEVVLNLCKVLQVLFGESRDKVREELTKLGFSTSDIETNFIPIMILRAELDVAHASLTIFSQKQLTDMYNYLDLAEQNFRKMLQAVFEKASANQYTITPDPTPSLKEDKLKTMENLFSRFESATSRADGGVRGGTL